ncbi:MAG: nuclear transport factor 2 family protein [Rhodospirillaceae bacterium]
MLHIALALLASSLNVAAAAQGGDACDVGRRYIELVSKGEFAAVARLFAPDAVVYAPTGKVYRGAEEITRFYTVEAAKLKGLVVRPQGFVGSATECYFEIWARSSKDAAGVYVLDPKGEFVRNAIDHFTLDAQGRVVEMVAHSAPTANMFKGSN